MPCRRPSILGTARCRPGTARVLAHGAILPALLLCSCREQEPSAPPPAAGEGAVHQLDELSTAQRRVFLKGFAGDWRVDTDSARGRPEPPAQLPIPPGARLIELPAPATLDLGQMPVRDAIARRRSRRDFTEDPLTLAQLSFLLSSTQGVTRTLRDDAGTATVHFRASPSGGARYPLETFLVVQRVQGLAPGLYRYLPVRHQLVVVREEPGIAAGLQRACYDDPTAGSAALVFVWAAVPARTEWKYGCIAHKMIAIEAGHVCQNLYLASESIGAGTCALLGYHQPALDTLLAADGQDLFTVYLAAVGIPAASPP